MLIGQAYGAKEPERVKAVAGTTLTVTLLAGIVVAVLGSIFVRQILTPLGFPPPRFALPAGLAYAAAAVREAFDTYVRGGTLHAEDGLSRFAVRYITTHHYYSHAKATRDLDYHPRVRLAEGIERTVDYFRGTQAR